MSKDPRDEADEVNEPFANVPANLRTIVETVGIIDPANLDEDAAEVLAPATEGRCMTCHTELGETSLLLINTHGIGAVYCGGACMQDMAVLGWLQEEHDDIVDKVHFRGGQGEADGEPQS